MGFENMPKPKAETRQERFNRTETEEKRLAKERRQANLKRIAEQGQKKEADTSGDLTKDMERFTDEGNPN